jgi:hypothetical protein
METFHLSRQRGSQTLQTKIDGSLVLIEKLTANFRTLLFQIFSLVRTYDRGFTVENSLNETRLYKTFITLHAPISRVMSTRS